MAPLGCNESLVPFRAIPEAKALTYTANIGPRKPDVGILDEIFMPQPDHFSLPVPFQNDPKPGSHDVVASLEDFTGHVIGAGRTGLSSGTVISSLSKRNLQTMPHRRNCSPCCWERKHGKHP